MGQIPLLQLYDYLCENQIYSCRQKSLQIFITLFLNLIFLIEKKKLEFAIASFINFIGLRKINSNFKKNWTILRGQ